MINEAGSRALAATMEALAALVQGDERSGDAVMLTEVMDLARAYRRSVSDFVAHRTVSEGFVPQFRAASEANEEAGEVAYELQSRAEDFVELEHLTSTPAPRLYPSPYETSGADAEQIGEDVANAERSRLGMGDGPASDLRERLATRRPVSIAELSNCIARSPQE